MKNNQQERFYVEFGGIQSAYNNTKLIIRDRKYRDGNNTIEIAGYVRYENKGIEISQKYKNEDELLLFLQKKDF